jgi:hypothetical protein
MSNLLNKFFDGIILRITTYASAIHDHEGAVWLEDDSGNKLKCYIDSAKREIVTEDGVQVFTNKTFDADATGNVLSNIENANIKAGAAIDAAKIHDASVSNTEFGYLDGVTSSIQTQLDGKQTTTLSDENVLIGNSSNVATAVDTGAVGDIQADESVGLTIKAGAVDTTELAAGAVTNTEVDASAAIAATKIHDGSVDNTEFGYLNGVTSALQTQLDAKLDDFSGTTDNVLVKTDGATGEAVQESGIAVTDADAMSGVTQLDVDNLRLDGNTIISTDTNGDISLTPDGSGEVNISKVDIDAGTIDGTTNTGCSVVTPSRLDVKQDTFANLQTYASSASNGQLCFATDTKVMYQVVDSALVLVGGGGTDGDADTIHLLRADDFDSISDVDLTGNNADFDGGGTITASSLTLSTTAADLIIGDSVIKYSPGADGSDDYFGFTKAIPLGLRGRSLGFAFEYKTSSTTVDADFRFCVKIKDGVNAGDITYFDMDAFSSNNNAIKFTTDSFIPNDCTEIEFGWQNTDTTTTVELFVDNIEVSGVIGRYSTIQEENVFTARITNNGTAAIVTQGGVDKDGNNAIASVSRTGAGIVRITYNTGFFSVHPAVGALCFSTLGNYNANGVGGSTSTVDIHVRDNGSNAYSDQNFDIVIFRQGSDYKQAVDHVITPAKSNMTDWTSFSPTSSWTTNTTHTAWYKRVGDEMLIQGNIVLAGAPDSADLTITLADSQVIDTTKIDANTDNAVLGKWSYADGGIRETDGLRVLYNDATTVKFTKDDAVINQASPITWASGDEIWYELRVPISGWTSEATFLAAIPVQKTVYLKDKKTSGTSGGTSVTNTATTRDLNTIEGDSTLVTLSSNQFTLGAGTYEIDVSAPCFKGASNMIFLYNVSDSTYDIDGQNTQCTVSGLVQASALLSGRIAISSSKTYEIRHWVETGATTTGFGVATTATGNPKSSETYTTVKITKIK